jgi:DHA2 family metal-tetracycline-proton antiporter-like MFS transporter
VGIGAICLVLGNLITAYYTGPSPLGVAVGMGLYGIGFAGIQSPLVSAASQLVPTEMTGVGMGIFMMIFFIGGAFGTALSVTTVELQPAGAASWLGLSLQGGEPYSNGILVLTGLAVLAVLLVPVLPNKIESDVSQHPNHH